MLLEFKCKILYTFPTSKIVIFMLHMVSLYANEVILDIWGVFVLLNYLHKSFSDSGAKATQIAHAPEKRAISRRCTFLMNSPLSILASLGFTCN